MLSVLLVEDDDDDAYLIEKLMKSDDTQEYDVERVHSLASCLTALLDRSIDILLLDLNLTDSSGINTLSCVINENVECPVIVLTNQSDGDAGTEAIQTGAEDFLNKGSLHVELLSRSIRYSVERYKLKLDLKNRAYIDYLTNLPNRLMFIDRLNSLISASQRNGSSLAIAMIDLNKFKVVNDSFGHACGDDLLQKVADILEAETRQSDIVARFGGDEFVCALTEFNSKEGLLQSIERKVQALYQPISLHCNDHIEMITVGASAGVACYPENGTTVDELLQAADCAMYAAKASDTSKVIFCIDLSDS